MGTPHIGHVGELAAAIFQLRVLYRRAATLPALAAIIAWSSDTTQSSEPQQLLLAPLLRQNRLRSVTTGVNPVQTAAG